jgi:hypothetical protein
MYSGIAGGHIPIYIVDHILWSCDSLDETHNKFKQDSILFAVPVLREIYFSLVNKPSLLSRVCDELFSEKIPLNAKQSAVNALLDLFNILVRFRGPHTQLAIAGFQVRDEDATGTSGFRPTMLEDLLELTRKQKQILVETALKNGCRT